LPLKKVAAIAPPATLAGRQQDKPKMPEPTPEAMRAAARVLAARQLSKRRQSEIARLAANARWGKEKVAKGKRP
jgi:hypothetical protein